MLRCASEGEGFLLFLQLPDDVKWPFFRHLRSHYVGKAFLLALAAVILARILYLSLQLGYLGGIAHWKARMVKITADESAEEEYAVAFAPDRA